jgi:hypothetical protein
MDADHPARGALHLYLPGGADSLVAAAAVLRRSDRSCWVTLAREHRLPVLLERPLAELAEEVWLLGYSGTGNPLLPSALEAHLTHRPVHWLSATTGRIRLAAAELPGMRFESMPGGSLVPLALEAWPGEWTDEERAYERLGFILGRYSGARPSDAELRLANDLHAASVGVRNEERAGAGLVRELAEAPVAQWRGLPTLRTLAKRGERRIRDARAALRGVEPDFGGARGPGIWLVDAGRIARGAHGKAIADRTYARQAPCLLLERVESGWTKAWIALPPHRAGLWLRLMNEAVRFSVDFSYTGLRGAGAVPGDLVDAFAEAFWPLLQRTTD